MLKQKPMITVKQAEKLVYDMVRYSDHNLPNVRRLSDIQIEEWFKQNKRPWKSFITEVCAFVNPIPFVENLLGYEWELQAPDNTSVTVFQHGHETAKLKGSGQVSVFDYHAKFSKALEERDAAIKKRSYSHLLDCVTNGVASVESYITSKANIWNKNNQQPQIKIDNTSNLDEKLNDWLYVMVQHKMNQEGAIWNHFTDFRKLNNEVFKHNSTGSNSASYNEMVKLINKFRTGIAGILFKLHLLFKEPVPSRIIRGLYLPDVFISKS